MRRATDPVKFATFLDKISIHALREESDQDHAPSAPRYYISIHALREESDRFASRPTSLIVQFQSTLSVRRATDEVGDFVEDFHISIHALREESD